MTGPQEAITLALLLVLVLAPWKATAHQLEQVFEDLIDQFRGGPRPPSQALLSNDSWILNRKRSKPESLPRKRG